ncbi:MAG: hypothetical protein MJ252_10600, partial [archaeon]|nr:hypothetical protein [archaeon]
IQNIHSGNNSKDKDIFRHTKFLSKQISPRHSNKPDKKEKNNPNVAEYDSAYLKKFILSQKNIKEENNSTGTTINQNKTSQNSKIINCRSTNNSKPKNIKEVEIKSGNEGRIKSSNKSKVQKESEINYAQKKKIPGFDLGFISKYISKSTMQTKKNSRVNSSEKRKSNKNSKKTLEVSLNKIKNNESKGNNKSSKNSYSALVKVNNSKDNKEIKETNNKQFEIDSLKNTAPAVSFNAKDKNSNNQNQLSLSNSLLNINFKNLFKINLTKSKKNETNNLYCNKLSKKHAENSEIIKVNPTKNKGLTSNNSLEIQNSKQKNEPNEQMMFKQRIEMKYKNNSSATSIKSKHASKSSSQVDDFSNSKIPKSKHQHNMSKDNFYSSKGNDKLYAEIKKCTNLGKNIISVSSNQSAKNTITHYDNKNNSAQNTIHQESKPTKQIEVNCLKSSLDGYKNNKKDLNTALLYYNKEKNKENNDTIESLNSTMRDNAYYMKEMNKISHYIRKCKHILIYF